MAFEVRYSVLLLLAFLLAVQAAFFAWRQWMPARALLIPAVRATVQLAAMALLLDRVFRSESVPLAIVILSLMAVSATEVVRSRMGVPVKERAVGDSLDLLFVLLGLTALTSSALAGLSSDGADWIRKAIPFAGLVLGNSLSALAVSIDRLRSSIRSQRGTIEARLLTGASMGEAVAPHFAPALRAGMAPILGAMSGAGLVSLPGALSGQLMAGGDPLPAVKLQLLVLGGLCVGSGSAAALLLKLWIHRRIDAERETFRAEVFA